MQNNKPDEMVFISDDPETPRDQRLSLRISRDENDDWFVSIAPVNDVSTGSVRIRPIRKTEKRYPGFAKAIESAHKSLEDVQVDEILPQLLCKVVMKLTLILGALYLIYVTHGNCTNLTIWVLNGLGITGISPKSFIVMFITIIAQLYVFFEVAGRLMAFLQNKLPSVFGRKKMVW